MREVIAVVGQEIPLGRYGEHLATCVSFDISEWVNTYGEGIVQLLHRRNGDSAPYPCDITRNGETVVWEITRSDAGVAGRGSAELQYYVDEVLVKSETYDTMTERAIYRGGEEAPEPYQSWMDKMLEAASKVEGATVIGQEVLADQKFVPLREEWEDYADAMAAGVASYLCNMAPGTTDCVEGTPRQDNPFVAVYRDDYSVLYTNLLKYDAVVDGQTTFGHCETESWKPTKDGNHDVINHGGKEYPILYMNCSGFTTLLTKGRDYRSSPYYRLFTDPDATARQLAALCLEKGDTNESPWTYDCLNVLLTWRMMEILRSSGCTPFPVASRVDGRVTFDEDGLGKLRDGDMLFAGNEGKNPGRYKGISHCMMYFRDLERLNAAAKAWGDVTLQPYDGGSGKYGYFVHCSGSTDGVALSKYNVLRIETMDHYVQNEISDGAVVWGVRVASNALNSAKLHQSITGRLLLLDCAVVNAYRHNSDLDTIPINHVESMKEGTQNGIFSYGQFRYSQPRTIAGAGDTLDFNDYLGSKNAGVYCVWDIGVNLVNAPTAGNVTPGSATLQNPNASLLMLEVVDVSVVNKYTLQRLSTLSTSYQHTWERVINWQGTPGKWREVCDVTQALDMASKACPADTASGAEAVFDDGADGMFLKSVIATLNPAQEGSGTPSPSNVRPFVGMTSFEVKRDDGTGGNAVTVKADIVSDEPVYGGVFDSASGKLSLYRKQITLTGNDIKGRGTTKVSGKYRFYTGVYSDADKDASLDETKYPACDRLASTSSTDSYNAAKSGICMLGSEKRIYIYTEEMSAYTLDQFKAWVNANPLTVFYTLADPSGEIAVEMQMPTTLHGDNRITAKSVADGAYADCPSVTVEYRADPTMYIDKKIAALTAQN